MEKEFWPHVPNWRARVGSDQHAEGGSLLNLSAFHVHPLYTTRQRYDPALKNGAYWAVYDIALVTLAESVDASNTPAELSLVGDARRMGSQCFRAGRTGQSSATDSAAADENRGEAGALRGAQQQIRHRLVQFDAADVHHGSQRQKPKSPGRWRQWQSGLGWQHGCWGHIICYL